MSHSTVKEGRIWVLTGIPGQLIEDIDTDQIYHNAFLHITELAQMGAYALGNLEGWKDFASRVEPHDMIFAGRNFGAGSSRQQAVDCFIALKVDLIAAPSFGAIYFRNAVNSGFPLLTFPELPRLVEQGHLQTGDRFRVDLRTGSGRNLTRDQEVWMQPMEGVPYDIWRAGDLFAYARSWEG